MEKLNGWKTRDGREFKTKPEAEKHEAGLDLEAWFIKARGPETDITADEAVDNIVSAALVDAPRLLKLLKRLAPVRRPRSSKKPKLVDAAG